MSRTLFRRLDRLEYGSQVVLPWHLPLLEWTDDQRDTLDDLNRRGLRLDEAHALILDEIANYPPPGRVNRGRA